MTFYLKKSNSKTIIYTLLLGAYTVVKMDPERARIGKYRSKSGFGMDLDRTLSDHVTRWFAVSNRISKSGFV